jgi:hypothetical protein
MEIITFETDAFNEIMKSINEIKESLKRQEIKSPNVKEVRMLNLKEAALLLGYTPGTLRVKAHRREVPHKKQGKFLKFSQKALWEWMSKNDVKTNEDIEQVAQKYISSTRNRKGGVR